MFTFGSWRVVFCWTLFRKVTPLSADGLLLVLPFISCVPSGFVMVRCVASSVLGVKERRNSVIAGKFAADFTEELHAIMRERTAYDNLSTKQLCPEVLPRNTRDLLLDPTTRQPKVERR